MGIVIRFTKKQWLCAFLLFLVFLTLNSHTFWKLMYPIQYEEDVQEAAEHFNVDPFLILAVMKIESGFKQERASKKGAEGLMQLMPETAEWINEKSGLNKAPHAYRHDPRDNILLGTWYLSYLLDKYQGDYVKTLVAYNAGQGNVDRWLAEGVWDGREYTIDQVPFGETRHYVKRALFYYDRYKKIYEEHF
ncbi:soluble lytic murein transglycosylase [Caldalkalibacillus uzonensis]|uniref:Soluble lytic murein transglycosylase n=1 Tax=Caldalkalibacillus uzonensis TaxID=353224 RepID=A0ABU0CN47_9BACI|nr:soluble lytic murein transglycosylase [Caldalkalibacillus uzonensis]